MIEAGFSHPCKSTCSGYAQAQSEVFDAVLERLRGASKRPDDMAAILSNYIESSRSLILGTEEDI